MEKMTGLSIFRKTTLLALFLFGVISVLTSALAAYTLYGRMAQEYVSKGDAIAQSIASTTPEILLDNDVTTVQAMIDQYLEIEGVAYVFVMDGDRFVLSHTFVPQMPPKLTTLLESSSGTTINEFEVEPFGRVIDISQPILAGVAGYVHVGMDKELIMDYFWTSILEMQFLLLFILLGCVGILYVVTGRISQPLTNLTEYAKRLAAHDFDATIDTSSNDEIGELSRSMHSMAGELASLFKSMESEVNKKTSELQEHMAYLSSIIDNLADGLLVVGPSGMVTVMNPVMREFFDLGDKDYVGFSVDDVFPAEVSELTLPLRQCADGIVSAEIPLTHGRTGKGVGSTICVEEPIRQCMGGVILVRDITREKELDQLKTDFISTVSHELRTPMTSVLGFAKIIRKKLDRSISPNLSEESGLVRPVAQVRENMEIIVDEAQRLTELINDVLDIAKMEAGEVQWREEVVAMEDILRQSVDSTRGMWKAKNIDVVIEVEEGLIPVRGDRGRLVQVMVNLISNAVKFTEVGPVVCRAHSDGSFVLVSVEDSGMGIPPDALDDIFDKFKQVGDTLTEKPTGTGLGLPISRQIVEYHGGSIWVESEEGKGSTFSFNIPAARLRDAVDGEEEDTCGHILPEPDSAMLVAACPIESGAPLILVVDDDPALGNYLTQLFEEEEFRVVVAHDGEAAVKMARELLPNLITMDIMMPTMDGRRAIRCLRNNPFTRHIPVLVLSALTDAFSMGGDIALTKPVNGEHLVEVTRSLLLEKDMSHSCLVLGDESRLNEPVTVFCADEIRYCRPEEVWEAVDEGFAGTVFVPSELEERIDIASLSDQTGISVVVLPKRSEDELL